ncbi:MAG: T9SS type A sorting domain-containing protein [Bacteroidota bacterium]
MKQELHNRHSFHKVQTFFLSAISLRKLSSFLIMPLIFLFTFFNTQSNAQVGSWTPLTNLAPDLSGGGMLLLSDGTVIVKTESGGTDGIGSLWNKLTPDIHGSYLSGTWSSIAAMHSTRLYYSSQILKDGRVYVAGGEYGTGYTQGETYDPLTNVWTTNPSPGAVSDANSAILEDGRVLQALVTGNLKGNVIYNPLTNTYSAGPSCLGIHNESAWVKLPDNSILMVDRLSTSSERYIPSLNQWVADGTVPVALFDPFGDETGGAVMLPDGRAFFIGSPGNTAYYTPSGNNSPGTWAAGPVIPGSHGTPDAAAAMMVNGRVLCAVSPVPTSANHFPAPTSYYEFDYVANSFTQIDAPGGGLTRNHACYTANMLNLPDGTILYSEQDDDQYYIYTPGGSPLASGKPAINSITSSDCSTYTITGTKFNGISEGSTYGDDWQMSTNYPVIRLTSGTNVYYARTFNWNSTGVRRGTLADTTQFTLPPGLPAGTYSLVVTANGIASNPISFTPGALPSATITPGGPTTFCSGGSVVLNAPTGANLTYKWKKGGAIISGATLSSFTAISGGNYKVTVTNTLSGCSKTTGSATLITVNPLPTATITPMGPITFCAGGSVVLAGNTGAGLSYKWKKGVNFISGATVANYTATTGGNYRVQVTNSNSCSKVSGKVTVSVPCREGQKLIAENDFNVLVYPNPSSGDFTFDVQNATNEKITISIFDVAGRLVVSDVSDNSQFTVVSSQMMKGIYSAVITNGINNRVLKLVKTE